MTAGHHGRVEGMALPGSACANCGDVHPCAMVCTLDPRDYKMTILGMNVVCALVLCPDCAPGFLPWAFANDASD